MSTEQPPVSGAERIRSLTDQDSIYQAFDSYPWSKDKAFMSGLYAILGKPDANPQASLNDMATHARIFYYAQRIGVFIDFTDYQSWLGKHPGHRQPSVIPEEYASGSHNEQQPHQSASLLDWQVAAPKAELYVERGNDPSSASGSTEDQPSYPMGFAEMIKLLQEGQPIPGIRQIPNIIARDPSVKPVGSRIVPRKPWEKNATSQPAHVEPGEALDAVFPPADTEAEVSSHPADDPQDSLRGVSTTGPLT